MDNMMDMQTGAGAKNNRQYGRAVTTKLEAVRWYDFNQEHFIHCVAMVIGFELNMSSTLVTYHFVPY